MRNKNTLINGAILSEKANLFAKMLDIPNFTANNGWLGRWKKKKNIKYSKMYGEKASANQYGADEWKTNILPTILNDYDPQDIFNADETGLYYKALPNGTFKY